MTTSVVSRSSTRPSPRLEDLGIERVDWRDLGPEFIAEWGRPAGRFEPEHLTVYGRSGGGKSWFLTEILALRARVRGSHVVYVATKRADKTIDRLHRHYGWPIVSDWPPGYGHNQVIFWARGGLNPEARLKQRIQIRGLMDKLWVPDSNIIVTWDELTYVQDMLKLGPELETYYREGRSNGITNAAAMQRPTKVTRLAHSEAGWTGAFPPKDQDDRRRVAEVLGDRARFSLALDQLDRERHEFLLRHERTGAVYATHLRPLLASRRRADSGGGRSGVPSHHR